MENIIRECIVDDFIGIHKLNSEEMGYNYPLEDTKENLSQLLKSENDKIYVAVINNEIAGYVHASTYSLVFAPHMKNIMGIAVSSKYKRKGIGSALLKKVETWASETGAKGIRLVSGASRTEAHSFYRKNGFVGDKMQLNLKKML